MKKLTTILLLSFICSIGWGQKLLVKSSTDKIVYFQNQFTAKILPRIDFAVFNGINSIGVADYNTNMQNPTTVLNSQFKNYTGIIDDLIKDSFDNWILINSATTETPLAVTGYQDSVSCRIRNDGTRTGGIRQTMTVTPGDYIISFKHKAEGGKGRYAIYDVTNASYLIALKTTTDSSSTEFITESNYFTVPESSSSIRVDFFSPGELLGATTLANINIFRAYDMSVAFFLERNIDSFNIDRDYFISRLYSSTSPLSNERSWSIRAAGDEASTELQGTMRFSYSKTLNTSAAGVFSTTKLDSGVVYHVACTYKYNGDGTSDAKIYINGVLETESLGVSGYIVNSVANFTIGDLQPNPYHPSSCIISNIFFAKREFAQSDIDNLYLLEDINSDLKYKSNNIDSDNNIWYETEVGNDAILQNVTEVNKYTR